MKEHQKINKNVIHKKAYVEKCSAFDRFNDWELQLQEKPDYAICLAAVFELYDLVPDQARQRPVNVEGIIKMQKELACLA
jgi:hypothetical protein